MNTITNSNVIFKELEQILKKSAQKHNLLIKTAVFGSVAKTPKRQLHLYGNKEVQILKRPKQKTYIVGIMNNKNSTGFYSMAVYAFPKEFNLSPELKKILKGKSCFQIKHMDSKLKKEISDIVDKNILLFRKEGWLG